MLSNNLEHTFVYIFFRVRSRAPTFVAPSAPTVNIILAVLEI